MSIIDYFQSEGVVVIRVAHISVVQKPHVSVVLDFVVLSVEKLLEILTGLDQVGEPDHCGQVCMSSLQEGASQSHFLGILLVSCLYSNVSNQLE